jgi:hypothetical protein
MDQLLIRFSAFIIYWEYNETLHQLFVYFKKAYDSVRMEGPYSIRIDSGIPMKVVRLINIY